MEHSLIIRIPDEPGPGRNRDLYTPDEIQKRIEEHLRRFGGVPGIEIIEYRQRPFFEIDHVGE